jgi:hypothetical protein
MNLDKKLSARQSSKIIEVQCFNVLRLEIVYKYMKKHKSVEYFKIIRGFANKAENTEDRAKFCFSIHNITRETIRKA